MSVVNKGRQDVLSGRPSTTSDSDSAQSRSVDSSDSSKEAKVVLPEENKDAEEADGNDVESCSGQQEGNDSNVFDKYRNFLPIIQGDGDMSEKRKAVEQIRRLLKDDEEARNFMGGHGFVEALVQFLRMARVVKDDLSMEVGAMALFNLAVNNNRNKELMMAAGVIHMVEEMTAYPASYGLAAALYLNLSCLEEAKPIIGSSKAVPFLIKLLVEKTNPQTKVDSLHALFNLSVYSPNIPNLLQSGIINALQKLLSEPRDNRWTEESIAVLINLASNSTARAAIISSPALISALAAILDTGEAIEQEQSVSCLLILCSCSEKCSEMVLQEGVIPSLVSIQVNGTSRGRDKAQKLLMLFREQRQRDASPQQIQRSPSVYEFAAQAGEVKPLSKSNSVNVMSAMDQKAGLGKATSRRKIGKTFSFFRKSKNLSGPQ